MRCTPSWSALTLLLLAIGVLLPASVVAGGSVAQQRPETPARIPAQAPGGGAASASPGPQAAPSTATPIPGARIATVVDESGGSNLLTIVSNVAAALLPAVVHIDVVGPQQSTIASRLSQFGGNDRRPPAAPQRALGSGVLIDERGHVLTNNHVIEQATSIRVTTFDGVRRAATVVGRDPATDLAVLQILDPPEGIVYAAFGDSDQLRVGQWVVAIGSPQGLERTVTHGIVSAKHRASLGAYGPSGYEDFIQTDASINPGNSGGPLLNLSGEVIGINSLIVSATGSSVGLGFAIPARLASAVAAELIRAGRVVRGYLGVTVQDFTDEMARRLGASAGLRGAVVSGVDPGGPAARAGIQPGDVIVGFADQPIGSAQELRQRVALTRPGSRVELQLQRRDGVAAVWLVLADLGDYAIRAAALRPGALLDIDVLPLTADLASLLGTPPGRGVVVTDVTTGGRGHRSGLQPGDVIVAVGRGQATSPAELERLLRNNGFSLRLILFVRDVNSGRLFAVPVATR